MGVSEPAAIGEQHPHMVSVPDSQAQVVDRFKRSNGSIGKEFSTMTKSKGIGRGGARPNSGPKKKPVTGPPQVADAANAPSIIPEGLSDEEIVKFKRKAADEALLAVAMYSTSDNARVAAAKELNDRTLGKPKPGAAAKPEQNDLFDDGWGTLLQSKQPAAGRTN
jgi:hypothetical protein